ncbi:UNVERIFIED_CONTAM: hypothetical protein PYX00_001646 [Menopon gallinae]|uniref:Phosphodiesterase n=1 Tax=Menopon gallinae TaxID=328185 RepID=A0AAW2IEX1_9NEOP
MIDPGTPSARTKRLSQSDWLLLETLDTRCQRPLHTGRFLTMHKRRRKRLITRSLTQDHALLDDIHHGQVQCVLSRVNQWPFNAFILDNVTGGRSLPVLCVHLFHWYGLLDHFKLDVVRCWKFFSLIEEGYHSTNPYHNSIHATDVTQAMHCFLQEKKIREHLTPLEIMASLIAAVTHDLDHPGVNQPFLIATSNHLAALYENTSVLENHHWRSAIGCLLESHVAEEIEDCRPELQRQISSLILATDITRQQEFLIRFKRYLDQDLLDMRLEEHRHFILQIALKCADISNPCRPWEVSKKWSQKVCEEFFRQGDYERQLNLPVTALCDRQSTSVPKIQAGFFKFVVYPLFEEWHRFLGDGLSDDMMKNLRDNQSKWNSLVEQESAEEAKVSDAEAPEEEMPEEEGNRDAEPEKRSNFLTIPAMDSHQRVGRRHSVPLSIPTPPTITRTIIRRESLAMGEQRVSRPFQSGLLEEEEEEQLINIGGSSLSLYSNSSGNFTRSNENDDRTISAENLLPEPSIASITTVTEANRLSTVMQASASPPVQQHKSQLTRQQTFPPIQPFVRQRYLSATAETITCSERFTDKSHSSASDQSEVCFVAKPPLPRDGVLKESNRSTKQTENGGKKFDAESSSREKGFKIMKMSEDSAVGLHEKENVDPRGADPDSDYYLLSKYGNSRRNSTQGQLSRRRGSAPVGSEIICPLALALRGCSDRYLRRGSVPVDAIRYNTDEGNNLRITQDSSAYSLPNPRRGSIPGETGWTESGGKGKSRGKKVLRRRSSGGPEMFCTSEYGNDNMKWRRDVISRRNGSDPVSDLATSRRRGSLPIDVLLATHSVNRRTLSQLRLV